MAPPAKQQLLAKDLSTSHVILYPTRAHVTRTIGNVELQPGANEIEIYGLTPTADEHSIKVDGTGAASITDMTVELVHNKESFLDVYPEDEDDDDESSEEEQSDSDSVPENVKAIEKEIEDIEARISRTHEMSSIASKAMSLFDDYSNKVEAKEMDVATADKIIERYRERRLEKHDEIAESNVAHRELHKELVRKRRQLRIATKEMRAEQKRKAREELRQAEKKDREKLEKKQEAARLRAEREKFWPKKVYQVTIHLDCASDTPGTSRRSSISSLTPAPEEVMGKQKSGEVDSTPRTASLTLSYVTSEASWTPRYDMTFSTPNASGSIAYRAEFKNATSETWKDTHVSLSTSQASFQGLDDEVPFMQPWHLGLTKNGYASDDNPPGLLCRQEQTHKAAKPHGYPQANNNRANFGIPSIPGHNVSSHHAVMEKKREHRRYDGRVMNSTHDASDIAPTGASRRYFPAATSAFTAPAANNSLFGSSAAATSFGGHGQQMLASQAAPPPPPLAAPMAASAPRRARGGAPGADLMDYDDEATLEGEGNAQAIKFEDSTWGDHGLTQTYDLPGTRTLEPSSLTRRYKIATLPFSNLILTSISVPKLRAAAFLRARFRNPSSSITLLKGTAGLTLDGTFLGNTTLPRSSPGELITLPLGVDPAVQVSYAKPTVKRSSQGVFNKESAQLFTRSIILTNTKSRTVELLVLDQVPLSEDEKLRVDVVQPKGLVREGDAVSAGVNAKQGKTAGEKWGKATAKFQKDGQIAWTVNLEKGAACRLPVEYEVRLPASDNIVSK